jgi:uncharacterized membrane protein YfcA
VSGLEIVAVLVAVGVSFAVSASVGLGGSLVLVPTLVIAIGPKPGVALAALLLGLNNVVKVVAYRDVLPWRAAALVVLATAGGALIGASALVAAPEWLVTTGVIAALALSWIAERRLVGIRRAGAPMLALGAGATSGFSGTSGPLKGVAIRNLGLDHRHMVGAASLASLAGDLTKTAVFAQAELLTGDALALAVASVPLMFAATLGGRRLNAALGERRYAALFWAVMSGYAVRLLVA